MTTHNRPSLQFFNHIGAAILNKFFLGCCLGVCLFAAGNFLAHTWCDVWREFKYMTGDYINGAVLEIATAQGMELAASAEPATPENIEQVIYEEARANDVNPTLILSIIKHESKSNPWATSHVGAMGLMQLMPATAKACGLRDGAEARSIRENIACGVWWYRKNLDQAGRNPIHALQGYNGGPNAIATIKRCGRDVACMGKYAQSFHYANNVFNDFITGKFNG